MRDNALFRTLMLSLVTGLLSFTRSSGEPVASEEEALRQATDHGVDDTTSRADFFQFVTRREIQAPRWNMTVYDQEAVAPGYWFIAPYELLDQKQRGKTWVGPYIYDGQGELIWSGTTLFDSFNVFDFRPVEVKGENMFTAIYAREDAGLIFDSSYQIREMISWSAGHDAANTHEFTLSDGGTKALVFTNELRQLSKKETQELGYEANCHLNTNRLLELDITKSPPNILFNWSLTDHISLDEITYPSQRDIKKDWRNGWDAYHCNAIDRFENGDLLISCGNTDALYKISRKDGSILWRLGGTKSDFEFTESANFSRQHHARVLSHNETHTTIRLFDNARGDSLDSTIHEYSRGLILSLHDGLTEVVAEYTHPNHEYSASGGSLEVLPNGNVFVGWASDTYISEYTADGRLVMEAKLPSKMSTYRSYKSPWIGRPTDPPHVWALASDNGASPRLSTEVYISWNGATDVAE